MHSKSLKKERGEKWQKKFVQALTLLQVNLFSNQKQAKLCQIVLWWLKKMEASQITCTRSISRKKKLNSDNGRILKRLLNKKWSKKKLRQKTKSANCFTSKRFEFSLNSFSSHSTPTKTDTSLQMRLILTMFLPKYLSYLLLCSKRWKALVNLCRKQTFATQPTTCSR